jgi:hypothetical protein
MSNPFQTGDVGYDQRAIRESIAAKQANRPRVDNQGKPIGTPTTYQYDNTGRMIGKVEQPTEPVTDGPPPATQATEQTPEFRLPRPNPAQGAGHDSGLQNLGISGQIADAEAVGDMHRMIALKQQQHYERL